jgi:hypothetical protein
MVTHSIIRSIATNHLPFDSFDSFDSFINCFEMSVSYPSTDLCLPPPGQTQMSNGMQKQNDIDSLSLTPIKRTGDP